MADGEVVFSVTADDADAQKKLAQLRREIERTAKSLEATGAKRDGITQQLENARAAARQTADEIAKVQQQLNKSSLTLSGYSAQRHKDMASVPEDVWMAAKEQQAQQLAERDRLLALQKQQEAEVAKLEGQEQKVLATLQQQTEQLETQKAEAGAVERSLASQSTRTMPDLAAATNQVTQSMSRGFRSILKWGFGIRSTFILLRRLRSAIKEGVTAFAAHDKQTQTSINNLKNALSGLKANWGAAFAPILNAVAPLLQKLISLLNSAANAINAFFSALGGASSYKKVVNNNNNLADSYKGAGGAAAEAEKQILGFDEINKLAENNSGGGGGGGAADKIETITEQINEDSFLSRLVITIQDVFFNWSNLNPEQIAKKIITGLLGLLGFVAGIALGLGPGGVLLFTIGGVAIGLLLSTLLFNNDGVLNGTEVKKMIALAINMLIGGALGGALFGFKGAVLGATIGAALTLAFEALDLDEKIDSALGEGTSDKILAIINGIVAGITAFQLTGGNIGAAALAGVVGFGLTLMLKNLEIDPNSGFTLPKAVTLELLTAAINAVLMGVLWFTATGGSATAGLIGASVGIALTMLVNKLTAKEGSAFGKAFTGNLRAVLNGIVGAGIGFVLGGGIAGAVFGMTVGVGITLLIQSLKAKAAQTDAFYQTEFGQEVKEIKDKVKGILETNEDINVHIDSINAIVDEQTMLDLQTAQQLIDDIFTLNNKENLTSEEAELLRQKVAALNSLGLSGINLSFDDTTGHVEQTRKEVQGLLDDILRQYKLEAMKEAYIEAYKKQTEATNNMKTATETAASATELYAQAEQNLATAQANFNAAYEEYQNFTGEYESAGSGAGISEEAQKAQENFSAAKQALEEAKTAYSETKTASEEANSALEATMGTFDKAVAKVGEIGEQWASLAVEGKEAGQNIVEGEAEGVTEATPKAEESAKDMAEKTLEAAKAALGENSPSKEMQTIGEYAVEGFALGIENKTARITSAITSVMNAAKSIVQSSVNEMISLWRSDWGRPRIHLPIFGLEGVFDFATGEAPQVIVADWLWMAKGGIVDGATPFVAGEAGKEAVIPLERNTEWVKMVASGIVDQLTSSNALADFVSNLSLPSIMSGRIVPPRALSGGGSIFSDGDIERLVSGITAALSTSGGEDQSIKLYLDGRQIAETVTKHQRRAVRGFS